MSKNVAVFVDVANIFYAAKAAGVDIDYVTLLKSAIAGRDFVRAYAYTGLDPDNENQRNFHAFLARHGYKVVSKDIRKYGDGKVKANLDIELVVDMLKTARNLDVAIVVSGDGDFAPAIRAVQEMGVRVEVISFRGNTSSDLMDVADSFTDIVNLARVEKGSSRSGRRVAGDDEDLSMTEVPDKQTEGTGRGRGRGRSRERAVPEVEPVAASGGRRGTRRSTGAPATATGTAGLLVLPGERLARVAAAPGTVGEPEGVEEIEEAPEAFEAASPVGAVAAEGRSEGFAVAEGDGARRRRRRGGRGRGRGRGRGEESFEERVERPPLAPRTLEEEPRVAAPRGPRTTPFGSVWDSQLGVERTPSSGLSSLPTDEEFEDEPEIPEYLLAERRNRAQGGRGPGGRGGRGGARSAYSAAVDRERYGRGGAGGSGTGLNRYPDVSRVSRQGQGQGGGRGQGYREERQPFSRPQRPPRGTSAEPWSEVPPEVEEMLRAQLAARGSQPSGPQRERDRSSDVPSPTEARTIADVSKRAERPKVGGGRRPASRAAAGVEPAGEPLSEATSEAAAGPATGRRTTRARTSTAKGTAGEGGVTTTPARRTRARATGASTPEEASGADSATSAAPAPAPKRRSTRTAATSKRSESSSTPAAAEGEASPRPRARRTKTEPA